MKVTHARTEIEFSLVWAQTNPMLFSQGIASIPNDYPFFDYKHEISFSRVGFVVITCTRRHDAKGIKL